MNPTAAGLALMGFGASAGMASALMGIIIYGGGAIASMLMGAFNPATPVPMTALMLLFGASALLADPSALPQACCPASPRRRKICHFRLSRGRRKTASHFSWPTLWYLPF